MTSRKIRLLANLLIATFSLVSLFWVNYQIIAFWFGKNGPANLGSIEVSYVSMGRFLRDFGFISWAPFWYLGFPFHLFYTPLLPFLEFLINQLTNLSFWEAYRLITGVSYLLVPVSVFFLGWQLSRRVIGGLLAGILYSVGPSIFYFILSSGEVVADRVSGNFLDPRRFTILVRWGEGPHTLSLVFLPLVGVFFVRFLKDRKLINLIGTSIFLGLTSLSNSLGLFSAILLIFSMTFVHFARKPKKKVQTLFLTAIAGFTSLGLVSFWYNLSFITNFFSEGEGALSRYLSLFPWGWLGALFGVLFFYWLIRRFLKDSGVATALVWFLILFAIVSVYYLSSPPELSELRIELLPQALRYNTEVDMSLSLLVGVLIGILMRWFGKKHFLLEIPITIITFIIIIILIIYIQPFIPIASKAASQALDLGETREYEISKWLEAHTIKEKGERVFVPGNYGFYLNYFTDVWQARGGLFQAATHPWVEHIHYQLANGKDPEIALAWLKIINAKYALITTAGSQEIYKEVKNLDRFEDLERVYEGKGDVIYKVDLVKPELAKSVDLDKMAQLTTPKKADDRMRILAYADWVENSGRGNLDFEVINNDNYKIRGSVGPGEGILVQMTYDAGWKASNVLGGANKKIKIGKDPMDFLVLYPQSGLPAQAGEIDILLRHARTWKEWLGYLTTFVTILFLIWYGLFGRHFTMLTKNKRSLKNNQTSC